MISLFLQLSILFFDLLLYYITFNSKYLWFRLTLFCFMDSDISSSQAPTEDICLNIFRFCWINGSIYESRTLDLTQWHTHWRIFDEKFKDSTIETIKLSLKSGTVELIYSINKFNFKYVPMGIMKKMIIILLLLLWNLKCCYPWKKGKEVYKIITSNT